MLMVSVSASAQIASALDIFYNCSSWGIWFWKQSIGAHTHARAPIRTNSCLIAVLLSHNFKKYFGASYEFHRCRSASSPLAVTATTKKKLLLILHTISIVEYTYTVLNFLMLYIQLYTLYCNTVYISIVRWFGIVYRYLHCTCANSKHNLVRGNRSSNGGKNRAVTVLTG